MDGISEKTNLFDPILEDIAALTIEGIKNFSESEIKDELIKQLKNVNVLIEDIDRLKNQYLVAYQTKLSNQRKEQIQYISEKRRGQEESEADLQKRRDMAYNEAQKIAQQGFRVKYGRLVQNRAIMERKILNKEYFSNLEGEQERWSKRKILEENARILNETQADEYIKKFNSTLLNLAKKAFVILSNIRKIFTGQEIKYNIQVEKSEINCFLTLSEQQFLNLWHISNDIFKGDSILDIPKKLERIELDIGKEELQNILNNHQINRIEINKERKEEENSMNIYKDLYFILDQLTETNYRNLSSSDKQEIYIESIKVLESHSLLKNVNLKNEINSEDNRNMMIKIINTYIENSHKKIAAINSRMSNWRIFTRELSSETMYQGGDVHGTDFDIQAKHVYMSDNTFTSASLHLQTILNHLYMIRDIFKPFLKGELDENEKQHLKAMIATAFTENRIEENIDKNVEDVVLDSLQNATKGSVFDRINIIIG